MAQSKCVKCDCTTFELSTNAPLGSNYKFNFIQCRNCGGVVGVTDFYNVGYFVKKIATRLGIS